jgi:hypothetical protein
VVVERLDRVDLPGSALSVVPAGVSFLAPEEAVLEAMLAGWVAQQRSRLLVASTVEQRVLVVRRFVAFSSVYPWQWSPGDVEEWTTSLVSQGLAFDDPELSAGRAVVLRVSDRPPLRVG